MSLQLISQYYNKIDRIIQYGGSYNESSLRAAFEQLLREYANARNLELIAELAYQTPGGTTVYPDGTLKDALRQDWGYWESKDQKDDLDQEILFKFGKGYPKDNILFEDTKTAILYQNGVQSGKAVNMKDAAALHALLTAFFSYERPEVSDFRRAIEQFKQDVPGLLKTLRGLIEAEAATNPKFQTARQTFLALAQQAINPKITLDDVREMIIQHVLTEDIFRTIFDEAQFHLENNIAKELQTVIGTFLTGATKRNLLAKIEPYYKYIKARAAGIADHHEKQKFLKVIYENFYKAYNPAAADKLGIVYTPNEIVRFMIEGTDYLLHKHFNRLLGDKNVEILDRRPARVRL
jgi:predicted helicase